MSELQKYLSEMQILQDKIHKILNKPHKIFTQQSYYFLDDVDENYPIHKDMLDYTYNYFLITLTFDSLISTNIDEYGQFYKLNDCLKYFSDYTYYACFEKHKNGILHAHILTNIEYHSFQKDLHNIKKIITKSIKLEPAINIKPVRSNAQDILRSFNYIFEHKKDHPKYKYIKINI